MVLESEIQVRPFILSSHYVVVLASFSPVGSRTNTTVLSTNTPDAAIVSQIQPKTATPHFSSSIARNVVKASHEDKEDGITGSRESSQHAATPLANNAGIDRLSRLSISGRLSQKTVVPLTPVASHNRDFGKTPNTAIKTDFVRDRFADGGDFDKTISITGRASGGLTGLSSSAISGPSDGNRLPAIANGPSDSNGATTLPGGHTVTAGNDDQSIGGRDYSKLPDRLSMAGNSNATRTVNHASHIVLSSDNGPSELVRSIVEKSVGEAMSEIRNDIQNLHIELIKQSIAQQNTLRQILTNLPESYKRLAEDYRQLQEENERLRLRSSH